jgi:hypothetical protein
MKTTVDEPSAVSRKSHGGDSEKKRPKAHHVVAYMQKHLSKKRRPDDIDAAADRRKRFENRKLGKSSPRIRSAEKRHQSPMIQIIRPQTRVKRLLLDCNRPSVLINLDATDFAARFKAVFEEHVEGFVGLRGAKKPKDDPNNKPEWRLRLDTKKQEDLSLKKSPATKIDAEALRRQAIDNYRALMASKRKPQGSSLP